jgi:ribosomal-protein-alanine N-acetyltransferase
MRLVFRVLEGKNVNLRVVEKEDLLQNAELINNPDYFGEYNPLVQMSKADLEKQYEKLGPEEKRFLIEKKDGNRIGGITHFPAGGNLEIGYVLIPSERGKGYGTEAVKIMTDYLFLSKDIVRVQAHTDVRNVASQKVLEKAGFSKEGTLRKSSFIRGEWRDNFVYSILREEWKEPRVLTKTA